MEFKILTLPREKLNYVNKYDFMEKQKTTYYLIVGSDWPQWRIFWVTCTGFNENKQNSHQDKNLTSDEFSQSPSLIRQNIHRIN